MKKFPTVPEALEELGVALIKPGKVRGKRLDGDPEDEAQHFYICAACGQAVDKRDLGQVFHHEMPGHTPLPTL